LAQSKQEYDQPSSSKSTAPGGLNQDSVALCEQIRVIDKRRITRVLGHLDDPHLEEVAKALRTILGL